MCWASRHPEQAGGEAKEHTSPVDEGAGHWKRWASEVCVCVFHHPRPCSFPPFHYRATERDEAGARAPTAAWRPTPRKADLDALKPQTGPPGAAPGGRRAGGPAGGRARAVKKTPNDTKYYAKYYRNSCMAEARSTEARKVVGKRAGQRVGFVSKGRPD